MNIRKAKHAESTIIANLFLASRRSALPTVPLVHSDDEVRVWYESHILPQDATWIAEDADKIVGFMSVNKNEIDQLYLAPGHLGEGIGSMFVELAKHLYPDYLQLYTFQVNTRARVFYEKHGFTNIRMTDGEYNEEKEPDIRYEWRPLPTA